MWSILTEVRVDEVKIIWYLRSNDKTILSRVIDNVVLFFNRIKVKKIDIIKMAEVTYYNQEGLDKLKEELQYLKTEGRAQIAKAISEARDKGDLSENAEYDAAKEAQGLHEAKIAKLEDALANARLIDESSLDTSKVLALSIVKIKNRKNNQEMTFQLVSETEADMKEGKISVKSPIAKGLLGKSVGDVAIVEVPAGQLEFEVLEISR